MENCQQGQTSSSSANGENTAMENCQQGQTSSSSANGENTAMENCQQGQTSSSSANDKSQSAAQAPPDKLLLTSDTPVRPV